MAYRWPDVEGCVHEALEGVGVRSVLRIRSDGKGGGDFARMPFVLIELIGAEESGPFRTAFVELSCYGGRRAEAAATLDRAVAALAAQPWALPSGVLDSVEVEQGVAARPWPDPDVHVYGARVAVEVTGY